MNIYNQLNRIYRALDVYNFPERYKPIEQVQSLRILHENRTTYYKIPQQTQLVNRLELLYLTNVQENNRQVIDEIYDVAMSMGVYLPNGLAQQRQALRNFEQQRPVKLNTDDIYDLKYISSDKQNVHHTTLNEHIKTIVVNICTKYKASLSQAMYEQLLSELKSLHSWNSEKNSASLEYIKKCNIDFGIGYTLSQVLAALYYYICCQKLDIKNELINRLNQELTDMFGKCSTGHLSRLINVLQGYSSEYSINIDTEREIKSFVNNYLTNQVQNLSEEDQDELLYTKNIESINHFTHKHSENCVLKFGEKYRTYILKCFKEYFIV